MPEKNALTGMAAIGSIVLSTGRKSGGGKRNPRGAANAAHRILLAMGEPMSGNAITATALGLGYWHSASATPQNNLRHVLDDSAKTADGVFQKDNGTFSLRPKAPAPLPVSGPDTPDPLAAAVYVVAVKGGSLKALPGVELPAVTVKPVQVAEYLAGKTVAEAGDAEKKQIAENAAVIGKILKG